VKHFFARSAFSPWLKIQSGGLNLAKRRPRKRADSRKNSIAQRRIIPREAAPELSGFKHEPSRRYAGRFF